MSVLATAAIALLILGMVSVMLVKAVCVRRVVPPFIRTRGSVAHEVAEAFGALPAGSIVFDLGAGDGRVLRATAARNPQAAFTGVELRRIPYLLALIRSAGRERGNIRYRRRNLFTEDLSNATHIYTYLYPQVMDRLLPKLEQEVAAGTKLISLDFPFSGKQEAARIPLRSASEHHLGRTLYIYEF